MIKSIVSIAILAAAVSAPNLTQAATFKPMTGGVVGGTLGTTAAVLKNLVPTVKAVVSALPAAAVSGGVALTNVVGAVPNLLTGAPVKSTSSSILVPLPGLKILDANLAVPGTLGVNAYVGGSPGVLVTVKTGS